MKSKFLDDLKLSLKSSGVKDTAANEITRVMTNTLEKANVLENLMMK